jgi:hypothetical protein
MLEQYDKAAEMLLVGFVKAWRLCDVAAAVGVDSLDSEQIGRLAASCPFLPSITYSYKRPVRAFVVSEWPKLADYLMRNEGSAAKVLAVVPQLKKLKASNAAPVSLLSGDDKNFAAKTRREYRLTATANEAARKQQKSTQRGAWNVCKG